MNLSLSQIIPEPHWQFPLSNELFEKLMFFEQYDLRATSVNNERAIIKVKDFCFLFYFTISEMEKSGVQFFSPGGSYKRRFIFWFNAYFWNKMEFEYKFEIKEKYFENIYHLVAKNIVVPNIDFDGSKKISITNHVKLTGLGKVFLKSITPFKEFQGTINFTS